MPFEGHDVAVADLIDLAAGSAGPTVANRSRAERGDFEPDPHGGHFLMGAQVGWSPRREGRSQAAGTVSHQDPRNCSECGGHVDATDLRTGRVVVVHGFEVGTGIAAVANAGRRIDPLSVCAGCLRAGSELESRTLAAVVAELARESRYAAMGGDPYAGLSAPADRRAASAPSGSEAQ